MSFEIKPTENKKNDSICCVSGCSKKAEYEVRFTRNFNNYGRYCFEHALNDVSERPSTIWKVN